MTTLAGEKLKHIWYQLDPTDPAPQVDELLSSIVKDGTAIGTVYLIATVRKVKSINHWPWLKV